MAQHPDTEEAKTVMSAISKLLSKKKIENPSDERLIRQSLDDYKNRGEYLEGTHKWFTSIINRNGKAFKHGE